MKVGGKRIPNRTRKNSEEVAKPVEEPEEDEELEPQKKEGFVSCFFYCTNIFFTKSV